MYKKYIDFCNEISSDELFDGLVGGGLFTDKLPPVFSSLSFMNYCKTMSSNFENRWYEYIHFDSMRNSNVPRQLGIPHPMAYANLCNCLKDNWENIKSILKSNTFGDNYKISRIHLRKRKGTISLFEMNYDNYKTDGSPDDDLMIGNRFIVKADISTCFPSIYSHSIPWALVGKDVAKANTKPSTLWYNKIDEMSRNNKNGETQGLIIGPHSSNLISEIVLTTIDSHLSKYSYIRNIDDYTLYAKDENEARQF